MYRGGAGDDKFVVRYGDDLIYGDLGNDKFAFYRSTSTDSPTMFGGDGDDGFTGFGFQGHCR